ncbi:hypothetical protein BJX99DRAFT_237769 [Aspergillus californicus]
MVYPGGPSRGCYTCRARKVKCDEMKPVCERCIKGNRTCGGYRILDNKSTANKRSSPEQSRPDFTASAQKNGVPLAARLEGSSISPYILFGQNPREDHAKLAAFYGQIIRLPQAQRLHGGILTTLPTVLAGLQQPLSSPLPSALTALLLTFVSEKGNESDRESATAAMACYGKALQLTRQLVEERRIERATELVMTIFVLGMYEDFTLEDHTKFTSNSHLEGVKAFVKMHTCKNFDDDTNRRIHTALLSRALFTCFDDIKDNALFIFTIDELYLLYGALLKEKDADILNTYTCALLLIHLQLRQLETNIWSPFPSDGVTVTIVVAAAQANVFLETISSLEKKMSEWPESIPPEWKYMTIQLASDDRIDLWSTDAHIYSTFLAVNEWSRYRTLQILIHSLRLRAYRLLADSLCYYNSSPIEYNSTQLAHLASNIAKAHSGIRSLTKDICASIPYHIGYKTRSVTGLRYPSDVFPNGKYARLMSACHVAWPLYVAGIVEGVDVAQRLWIARQLDFIKSEMGIGKAAVLAELVRGAAALESHNML